LEFIGLKAKMYSFALDDGGSGEMKAKGIPKAVVQRDLSHELYKKCARLCNQWCSTASSASGI